MLEFIKRTMNKIMDIIIPGLIICLGMLSMVGCFYSIALAFEYPFFNKNVKALFKSKKFLYSLFLEVVVAGLGFTIFLNARLLSTYSKFILVIVVCVLSLLMIATTGIVFTFLWLLLKDNSLNSFKALFQQAIVLFIVSFPYWLLIDAVLLIFTVSAVLYPALLLIVWGMMIFIIDNALSNTVKKLEKSGERYE